MVKNIRRWNSNIISYPIYIRGYVYYNCLNVSDIAYSAYTYVYLIVAPMYLQIALVLSIECANECKHLTTDLVDQSISAFVSNIDISLIWCLLPSHYIDFQLVADSSATDIMQFQGTAGQFIIALVQNDVVDDSIVIKHVALFSRNERY